jgi:hypothetical protein
MAMTPAERLRAAADTIERTATAATSGAWRTTGELHEPQVWSDEALETICDTATVQDAAHVALWDPPTALLIAASFRETARRADTLPRFTLTGTAAAVVDAIIAGGAK